MQKYKKEGEDAYKTKVSGRPRSKICQEFKDKVKEIRNKTGYGNRKIHVITTKEGFSVSQRQVRNVLDELNLTKPCPKRRGQKTYVRYQWPISNWMWHTDWSSFKGKEYCAYLDDRSRKIMAAGVYEEATQEHALQLFYKAIWLHKMCPVIVLSDKGSQYYNSTPNKKGELTPSPYQQELERLGIQFWTCRRAHPQTNGKMEKWFDTMKQGLQRQPKFQAFVEWYNEEYIHESLDYRTPEEVYKQNL